MAISGRPMAESCGKPVAMINDGLRSEQIAVSEQYDIPLISINFQLLSILLNEMNHFS
jgi:hypothetical protein